MSDYTTSNEGMGGRGVIIAILIICAFVFGLALIGASSGPAGDGTGDAMGATGGTAEETTAEDRATVVIE
ncbi:MAG: hypothetical protein WBC93_15810 [Sulfitobacter sp.]